MSLTVTLTVPLICGLLYLVISLMTSAAFLMDEWSFVNPHYFRAMLMGFAWPILLIQVTILARFDIYIGDVIEKYRTN